MYAGRCQNNGKRIEVSLVGRYVKQLCTQPRGGASTSTGSYTCLNKD